MKIGMFPLLIISIISISYACNSPSNSAASVPTYVAETAAARQAATAVIENALAVVLTGTASVPTLTPTSTPTLTPTVTSTPTPAPMATVIKENAPLFAGPGFFFGKLSELSYGEQIVLLGISEDGRWLLIELSSTDQGWIALEHTDPQERVSDLPQAEEPAREEYTITVVHGPNYYSKVTFSISDLGLTYTIQPENTISIKVLAGLHYFVYESYPIKCQFSQYIVSDMYFTISFSESYCERIN